MSHTSLARPKPRSRHAHRPAVASTAVSQPAPVTFSAQPRLRDRATVLAAGAAVFTVYLVTLAPTVAAEDSGELITAAHVLGVAHPPGYPLWCLVAWFFEHLVPFGSVAYRMNLCSAFFGAASAALCTATLLELGCRRAAALVAGLCLGFSKELWAQSVVAEVYSLNLFFVGLLILVLLKWQKTGQTRLLVLFAGFLGLGLGNHHTLLGVGAVGFLWIMWQKPSLVRSGRLWLSGVAAFLLGFSIYLYVPLSASGDPYLNWGDPDTPAEFWAHLTRSQYPSDFQKPRSLVRTAGQLGAVAGQCLAQWTAILLPFIAIGLVRARRHLGLLPLSVGIFACYTVGFTLLSNFEFQRENLEVIRVFYLPAYYVMALWLGLGLEQVLELIQGWKERLGLARVDPVAALAAVGVLPALLLWQHGAGNDYSRYEYAEDHARNLLASLEPRAIFFPSGDHNTFPVIYLHRVEGQRPDIAITDKYGYVEESLYREMPDRPTGRLSRDERRRIEDWIIENTSRPVYFTVKRDMSGLPGYQLQQAGLVYRIVRPGEDWQVTENLWGRYSYRNFQERSAASDYGSDQILSDYHFQKGMWLLGQGAHGKGLAALHQAAHHARGVRESYNNLASACAEHGLIEEAIRYYHQALAVDPRYAAARWNLARLYQGLGDLDRAIGQYETLATLDASDPRPYGQIGFLYRRQGDLTRAVAYWHRSLQRQPDQAQILEALGSVQQAEAPALALPAPAGASGSKSAGPEGPRLQIDAVKHDFGEVVEGSRPSHEFLLKNVGTQNVVISKIESSCRCAASLLSQDSIAPGGEAKLQVTLDTSGRPGEDHQDVTLHTNDPTQPQAVLRLAARVLPAVEVVPAIIDLGRVRPGETRTGVARIVCRADFPVEVGPLAAQSAPVIAEIHPDSPDSQGHAGYRLDAKLAPGLASGPLRGLVRLRTSHPRYAALEVPVIGQVPAYVDCQPPQVFFGSLARSQLAQARRSVLVHCDGVDRLEVRATASSALVEVSVEPADDPQAVELLVSLCGEPPAGYFSARVKLQTNVPEMPEVTLPVAALLR